MNSDQSAIPILPFARSALKLVPYDWQARVLCAIEARDKVALCTCNGGRQEHGDSAGGDSVVLVQ
jgi:hypothetical protein